MLINVLYSIKRHDEIEFQYFPEKVVVMYYIYLEKDEIGRTYNTRGEEEHM